MERISKRSMGLAAFGAILLLAVVAAVACAQAPAPAPTAAKPAVPTSAPSAPAPTKAPAAAPTKAPSAQPTAAPAPKVDFPAKGRSITMIAPVPAGGIMDITVRIMAPALEKELGVPVTVVNKPGAGTQIGMTELAKSKPDGYTIGHVAVQSTVGMYLDPQRKATATYVRKDFQPVALHNTDPETISVKADSPIKSLKEMVEILKAKPASLKVGTSGILTNNHLALMLFEKAAGVKFNLVHFDGGPPVVNALLGGHIDLAELALGASLAQAKSGTLRYLGIYDTAPSKFFPSAPTVEQQGVKVSFSQSRGFAVPAGTPREIVDIWANAIKRASESPDVVAKFDEAAVQLRFGGPAEFAAVWDEIERQTEPLLIEASKESKK